MTPKQQVAIKLALATFQLMGHKDSIFAGEFDLEISALEEALAEDSSGTEKPAQPSKPWVGLGEDEIDECFRITPDQYLSWHIYKRIEAKLREKNT